MAFETEVAILRDARWFVRNGQEYRRFDADHPLGPAYERVNLRGAVSRAAYIHHSRLPRITRHLSRTANAMLLAVQRGEVFRWKAAGPPVLFTKDGIRCFRPVREVDDPSAGFEPATRDQPGALADVNRRGLALDLLDRTLAIVDGHPWPTGPAPVHKPAAAPLFPLLSPSREGWPDRDPATPPPPPPLDEIEQFRQELLAMTEAERLAVLTQVLSIDGAALKPAREFMQLAHAFINRPDVEPGPMRASLEQTIGLVQKLGG